MPALFGDAKKLHGMGAFGVLSFRLGGALIIFALAVTFSTSGQIWGVVIGFVGFLGLGAGLDEMFSSGKERKP